MEKQYRYDAFISYRHKEKDKKIAEKLQKMLESYKPPKSLGKDFKPWRIFRDETELTTSSNLSDDIKSALESSRYLIVVCSEETKKSRWCLEEIDYFKALHNGSNKNIITLVADGEAPEVFPEALLTETIETKDENGVISHHTQVTEPLAANVASATEKGALKKLKTEFLRIAAPLLGCGYDALYNRNQKRTTRRLLTVFALIIAFLTAFGLYTSAMLVEIQTQKTALQTANVNLQAKTEELNQKNTELRQTNEELALKTKEAQENSEEAIRQKEAAESNLTEANRQRALAEANLEEANRQRALAEANLEEANRQQRIAETNLEEANRQRGIAEENMEIAQQNEARANEQTRLAQMENAENISVISENMWNNGDAIGAVETVLTALPQQGIDRPVVATAERVLAKEVQAFEKKSFRPVLKLTHEKKIESLGYAGNGKTVVVQTDDGVYLWDSRTGEQKAKFTKEMLGGYSLKVAFESDGMIENAVFERYNGSAFEVNAKGYIGGYAKALVPEVSCSEGEDLYIYADNDSLFKVSGENGEVLWKIEKEQERKYWNVQFSVLNDVILGVYNSYTDEERIIEVYDKTNGQLLNSYTLQWPYGTSSVDWLALEGDKLYYSFGQFSQFGNDLYVLDLSKLSHNHAFEDAVLLMEDERDGYEALAYSASIGNGMLVLSEKSIESLFSYNMNVRWFDKSTHALKWSVDLEETRNNHVRYVGMLYAKDTGSYCDMLAVVVGNKVTLIHAEDGTVEYTYTLSGDVLYAYASRSGIISLITSDGLEVVVSARNLTKSNLESPYFIGMYEVNRFLHAPGVAAAQNHSYAIANANSHEAYVYTTVQNPHFTEVFRNADDKSNSQVRMNSSGTHAVVLGLKEYYLCDISNGTTEQLGGEECTYLQCAFLNDDVFGVVCRKDSDRFLRIHSIEKETVVELQMGSTYGDGLYICGDVFAWYNGKTVYMASADGTVAERVFRKESSYSFREWDEGYLNVCSFSEGGQIAVAAEYYDSVGVRIEVGDVHAAASTIMDRSALSEKLTNTNVLELVWLGETRLAVCLEDHTIYVFDTGTGACVNTVSYETPNVQGIYSLGDGKQLAVLCSDSKVYKLNLETRTIDGVLDLECESIKSAASSALEHGVELLREQGQFILQWQTNAWVIDTASFKIRYEIPNYYGYSCGADIVAVNEYNIAGYYPLYTTSELVEMGNAFLLVR